MKKEKEAPEKGAGLPAAFIRDRNLLFVLPVPLLLVAAFIFWMFGGGTVREVEGGAELNTTIPQPKQQQIVADKMEAYRMAERDREERAKLADIERYALGSDTLLSTQNKDSAALHDDEAAALLNKVDQFESGSSEQQRIRELEEKIARMETDRSGSGGGGSSSSDPYSKYMEKMLEYQEKQMGIQNPATPEQPKEKRKVMEVTLTKKGVTSSLSGAGAQGNSNAFYTAGTATSTEDAVPANTISVAIHDNQTVSDGTTVKLRLLTDIYVEGRLVPQNTIIYGVARFQNERLGVEITEIRHGKHIMPVSLDVHDLDGIAGINVPASMDREAAKQGLGQAISSAGQGSHTVTMARDAKQQLVMEGVGTAIATTKNLLGRKVRSVKVHLKAGHKLYLVPDRNE